MQNLQKHLMESHIENLQKKLAFTKLKSIFKQSSAGESPTSMTSLTNKALYLSYMQEVLQNKENDLIKLQKQLTNRENKMEEENYRKGLKIVLGEIQVIKVMEKKLRVLQEKMGVRTEDYILLFKRFQDESAKTKKQMEEMFKKQYNDLINQRRTLRNKLSQFAELQSYERYLNELHNALQAKSQQLMERESMISQGEQQLHQQMQEFETNSKNPSNYSNRKRIKIFNAKMHYPSGQEHSSSKERNPYLSNSKQKMKLNLNLNREFNNETFSKWDNSNSKKNMNQHRNQILLQDHLQPNNNQYDINDSSAILAQNSREDTRQDFRDFQTNQTNQSNEKIYARYYETQSKADQSRTCDNSVQVDSESLSDAAERLRKQAIILKFAKKWMKYSFDSGKGSVTKKKMMAVNLWKINAFFDEGISQSAVHSIASLENVWRKQQKILYQSKMFPYNELSLKRKKYNQLMFDLEKKIYHRKRTQHLLKSILTQRHRKQRLIFYLYFCRFVKKSFNSAKISKQIREKMKLGQTGGTISGTAINTQSRSQLASMSSSHILNQQKIAHPHKKSTPILATTQSKSPLKSQTLSKQASSQKLQAQQNKENVPDFSKKQPQQNPKQAQKLHSLISEKERTERLLATQCVKLQGLIKMCVLLTGTTFKTTNWALRKLIDTQYQDTVDRLEGQLEGLEFRFQLVLAKCKLGLANNSNKISTLENLLDFSNSIK